MKYPPLHPVYPINSLRDLLSETVVRYRNKEALLSKKHGDYQPITYAQFGDRVKELSTALIRLGIEKGDRVAVLGPSCTEWAISYFAVVTAARVVVPIDVDLKRREIRHILKYSGARAIICAEDYVGYFRGDGSSPECLQTVISMAEETEAADQSFPEALQNGFEALKAGDDTYDHLTVARESTAAIIFTSGTTGSSKAVVLSHGNLASNVVAMSQFVAITPGDRLLSVLPLHHTYECTCGFLTALYQGATIYYAESLRRIPENLAESRATVMLGVPLLFETFYRRIEKGIKVKGETKFKLAKGLAGVTRRLLGIDMRRKLFKEIHERFGGHLRLLISGGAAGKAEVGKGFRDLGVAFLQGYGLTETSPLVSVNREGACKDASVGLLIPGIEVKFVDDEICVRGPNVMKGYYKNEAATRAAVIDGWFHTGDLGHMDKDGFLYISGRRKSLIVTPNGKNVHPEEVEAVLNESPFVLESLVWGGPGTDPSLTEVQAIVVPDLEAFDEAFGAAGYDEQKVHDVVSSEVKRCNQHLAKFKRVKKFTLREEEFEKTTTRKIKRYLYTHKPEPISSH